MHNDDRIEALIAVIGIALLIFGLMEAELRAALGPDVPFPHGADNALLKAAEAASRLAAGAPGPQMTSAWELFVTCPGLAATWPRR